MGKAALLAVAAFTVMGVYYGASTQSGFLAASDNLATHEYTVLAKNSALAGLNLAQQDLVQRYSASPATCPSSMPFKLNGTFEDGFYNATVTCTPTVAKVMSLGTVMGGSKIYTYRVEAEFAVETLWKQPTQPPAFLEYALISDKDLTIAGNVTFDTIYVAGSSTAKYNANIHTNGILTAKGNAAIIRGYGTYKIAQDVKHAGIFKPYTTADRGKSAVRQIPGGIPILVNDYHPDEMAKRMTVDETVTGPYKLEGVIDYRTKGATREDPYVVYVNGDLVSNNATIYGYAIFLVNGNIDFGGNVILDVGELDGYAESNFGFYTSGNIWLHGTPDAIWGQMVAHGDVTFSGTPTVMGSIACKGSFLGHGTPNVYFFPPSPALASPVAETVLKRTKYQEREI